MDSVLKAWEDHRSTVLEMATGTGKTVVFSEVIRRRRDQGRGRALVLAHRRELIEQAQKTLARFGLSTDVEMADQYARRELALVVSDVVAASVPTLRGRRLERWDPTAFGTIVVDEGHHAVAETYRKIVEHFAEAKVLGVTATGDRGDGIGLGAVFDSVAFRYPIRQAIDEGYLCPVRAQRVFCEDLDLSKVRSVRGDLSEADLQAAIQVDKVLHEIARPLVELAGDRQTIIFMPGVESAEALAEILGAYGKSGRVGFVHGKQPKLVRDDVIARFRAGGLQFLSNCAVLTEGFNAEETACVAVARPTKSRSLYAQMIGRGTRNAPGKVDLLVLDFVGNAGRHKLVGPADVLAGKEIPDDARQEIDNRSEGEPISLDEVDDLIAQAEERERARIARLEAAQRRGKVRADIRYRAESVDPFHLEVNIDWSDPGPRATPAQLGVLRRAGIEGTPSRREASKAIDAIVERRRAGLCSYKQARLLLRCGLRPDLTFEEAKVVIDQLSANRWKPTGALLAEYGRGAA